MIILSDSKRDFFLKEEQKDWANNGTEKGSYKRSSKQVTNNL